MKVIDPRKSLEPELVQDYHTFLKVFGWVHLILFGSFLYYTLAGIFQLSWMIEPSQQLNQHFSSNGNNSLIFQNVEAIQYAILTAFYAGALFSLLMIISALGLLKRENWARLLYNITVLGILVVGTGCGYYFYQKYSAFFTDIHRQEDHLLFAFDGIAKFFILVRLVFLIILSFGLVRGVLKLNAQGMIDYLNLDQAKVISP